ncbi:hypothetical protein [Hydromonas duriensis]|uniref:Uncharacterized protein n=1 Tax=Hydromonas duriensis TaxID=1527608 RepID=A0A4V3DJM6_9BURK|nr:hypothetical protein [Hydromonas duriensis]TDR30689.1 hypothetical protein DFR44_11839 [Hydromonas duriensis]
MLNNISQAIRRTAQALTLRHPNAVDVEVYRKTFTANAPHTMGGAALLSQADNADYAIQSVTTARMLFLGHLQGADLIGNVQGLAYNPEQILIEAYIEPVDERRALVTCELKKDDRVFWVMPNWVVEYQIKLIRSPNQLPPYVPVYVLEPLEHESDGHAMP